MNILKNILFCEKLNTFYAGGICTPLALLSFCRTRSCFHQPLKMACTPCRLIYIRNAVLDGAEMKCPKPCRSGNLCAYVGEDGAPCTFVHPGEQGVVRKVVPAHSFTSPRDGKQIYMPARVKLFAEDGDPRTAAFAPYYTRMKLGLSWPDWCEREGLALPPAGAKLPAWEDPKCLRLSYVVGFVSDEKELLYETQEERLAALEERLAGESEELRARFYRETNKTPVPGGQRPGPAAGGEAVVAEFSREEMQLAPFSAAAQLSLTMAAINASNARQQAAVEDARRAAAAQQWMWQQQQYLAWQQQQYAAWYAAQQPRPAPAAAAPPEDPIVVEIRRKNMIGERLYPIIKDALGDTVESRGALGLDHPSITAGKITGMFLEALSWAELEQLFVDSAFFLEQVTDACRVIIDAAAEVPQVTQSAEVRPAAAVPKPAVPGNAAMAACADDTVRQLLEDVRRIDAGLPLRKLPPSITSYEHQADGSVRVQTTVYPEERGGGGGRRGRRGGGR